MLQKLKSYLSKRPEPTAPGVILPKPINCAMRTKVSIGDRAKDKITGFTGIVSVISHELDGSVFVWLQPEALDGSGNPASMTDFDVERIEILVEGAVSCTDNSAALQSVKLGAVYRDVISGCEGTAVSITLFLGGCVRASLRGKTVKDNERPEPIMVPTENLELVNSDSVEALEDKKTATGGPGSRETALLNKRMNRSA